MLNQAVAGIDGGVNYLTSADPAALTYAFGYNEHNLQPEDQLAGEAATTAGAIYLVRIKQAKRTQTELQRRADHLDVPDLARLQAHV